MKDTNFIPIPLPLVENRTFKLSPRVEFYAKKAIMVMLKNIKREFAYQTFIETIAGNHIECELKAVMDFIHYGLFEASKEKDFKAFPGIPLFCFNKQWLIKRILVLYETHKHPLFSLAPSRE